MRNTLTSAWFQTAYRIAVAATLLAGLGLFAHSIITGAENWVWVIRTVMGAALMNSILEAAALSAEQAPGTRRMPTNEAGMAGIALGALIITLPGRGLTNDAGLAVMGLGAAVYLFSLLARALGRQPGGNPGQPERRGKGEN